MGYTHTHLWKCKLIHSFPKAIWQSVPRALKCLTQWYHFCDYSEETILKPEKAWCTKHPLCHCSSRQKHGNDLTTQQQGKGPSRFGTSTVWHVTLNYTHDKLPIPSKNDNLLMLISATQFVVDYKNGQRFFHLQPCPYSMLLQVLLSKGGIYFFTSWVQSKSVTYFGQWNVSKWDATRSLKNT